MLRVRAVSDVGAGNPVLETVITENIRESWFLLRTVMTVCVNTLVETQV